MAKPRKFVSGPWTLAADPPVCDPANPRRALAYCEKERKGERCTCGFDLAAIADDLEALGLDEHVSAFEDELDAESLAELVDEIQDHLQGEDASATERLRRELHLLAEVARAGSGLRPVDNDV